MAEKENQPKENREGMGSRPGYQSGKSEWPEVVGLTAEEAERKIKEEAGAGTQVHVVPPDSYLTMDFRPDRVRMFIDSSRKVIRPPRIG